MSFRMLLITACLCGSATIASAQSKTLAGTIGVFVFPADGQDSSEQSRDEAACFEWALEQTGSDPFQLARQSESNQAAADQAARQAQTAGTGSAVAGAATGAVAGAVVGNVFSSSSRSRRNLRTAGAAVGAAAGAANRQQQQAQAAANARRAEGRAQATEAEIEGFRNAFSACMEANNYVARF